MWAMMMEKKLILPFLIVVAIFGIGTMVDANASELPNANDVYITPNSIGMPLNRILLVRKDDDYCIVRFTRNWGKTDYDQHVEYESYYQGDKSGNFSNKNVQYRKEEVYYKRPIFFIFGHGVAIGAKLNIHCGQIELWWSAGPFLAFVYFNRADQDQKDYGIELAPTPWTDIKEVDLKDPRVKWYRYDEIRERVFVPIDKLLENKAKEKESGVKK